jgi:uncharacterized SAM-binding protein YcdF (DUF218 family)
MRIVRAIRLLAIPGAATVFWVVLLLHVTPVVPSVNRVLTDRWEEPAGDTLIVLGADQIGDGTIGIGTYWRTVYAVRAWRAGTIRRIVFSGGRMGFAERESLAAEMGRFAVGLGVPADVITLEERSLSTRENALFTADLVRSWPGSKVLMTSDYHMLRSRRAFERAGLAVRPAPIPDVAKRWNRWTARWDCMVTVAVELVKLGWYRSHGWA